MCHIISTRSPYLGDPARGRTQRVVGGVVVIALGTRHVVGGVVVALGAQQRAVGGVVVALGARRAIGGVVLVLGVLVCFAARRGGSGDGRGVLVCFAARRDGSGDGRGSVLGGGVLRGGAKGRRWWCRGEVERRELAVGELVGGHRGVDAQVLEMSWFFRYDGLLTYESPYVASVFESESESERPELVR